MNLNHGVRRILAAASLAVTLTAGVLPAVGFVPSAYAADAWCALDPLLIIVTPGGNVVNVHLTYYALGIQHAPALQLAQASYQATRVDEGRTRVKVSSFIPNDQWGSFPTRTVISSLPNAAGTIYEDDDSQSGHWSVSDFTVDVP